MRSRAAFYRHSVKSLSICAAVAAGLLAFSSAAAARAQTAAGQASGKISMDLGESATRTIFVHALVNQFEGRTSGPYSEFRWEGEGWIGTDTNRLWLKSEGFGANSTVSDGEQEALYDRPIPHTRYFDAQVGVREDLDSYPRRTWAAIGIEGLAPYYFRLAPTLYIGDSGHVAGRIIGSYDLLLTERWIVEPGAELNFYSKDDPARRIGSGLSQLDTGVRVRFEVSRKFAPYVGFAYYGRYGNTAGYSRQAGEAVIDSRFVFGLRLRY